MDDDLMSLRGSMGSDDDDPFGGFDDSDDSDDLFGGFDDPTTSEDFEDVPASPPPTSTDTVPDWLGQLRPDELDEEEKPAPEPEFSLPDPDAKPPRQRQQRNRQSSSQSDRGAMGLTPQQWMAVSIFLFLDVSLIGCGLLYVAGVFGF